MAGNAGAIRAGRAYVEIGGDDASLNTVMKRVESKLKTFGAAIAKVGAGFAAMGGTVLAPLLAATRNFEKTGSALLDISQRTGQTVEQLSRLSYAAAQTGADMAAVESAARRMARTIDDAGHGSSEASDTLSRLGLTVEQLQGLSPDDQFNRIAAAIAAIPDPTERAALAMAAFGKSGTSLLPMLADLPALTAAAERLDLVMSTADAVSAHKLGDALTDLYKVVGKLQEVIGSALAPKLTELIQVTTTVAGIIKDFANQNREAIVTAAKWAAGLTIVGGALTATGGAAFVAAQAFGAVATATKLVSAATVLLTGATAAQTTANYALATSAATVQAISGAGVLKLIAGVAAAGVAAGAIQKLAEQYQGLKNDIYGAMAAQTQATAAQQALAGMKTGGNTTGAAPVDDGRASNESIRALHEARIKNIEDEHEREVNLAIARGEAEIARAREAGANEATLSNMRKTLAIELGQLERNLEQKTHDEKMRNIQEREDAEKRRLEQQAEEEKRIAQANQNRADTIAELELEATYDGDELRQKQLELRKQNALRDAAAAGESLDMVKEEYAWREKILNKEIAARLQAVRDRMTKVVGAFNISTAHSLVGTDRGGNGREREIKAAEQTAAGMKRLVDASRTHRLVFG